jgi:hypothetical protein
VRGPGSVSVVPCTDELLFFEASGLADTRLLDMCPTFREACECPPALCVCLWFVCVWGGGARVVARYKNTTDNDLQYWGLDYPPLSYVRRGAPPPPPRYPLSCDEVVPSTAAQPQPPSATAVGTVLPVRCYPPPPGVIFSPSARSQCLRVLRSGAGGPSSRARAGGTAHVPGP